MKNKAYELMLELFQPLKEVEVNRGLPYYIFGVLMKRWEKEIK